jgi:hypothetical protein
MVSPKPEAVQRLLDEAREQIRPKADAKGIPFVLEDAEISACFDLNGRRKQFVILWITP